MTTAFAVNPRGLTLEELTSAIGCFKALDLNYRDAVTELELLFKGPKCAALAYCQRRLAELECQRAARPRNPKLVAERNYLADALDNHAAAVAAICEATGMPTIERAQALMWRYFSCWSVLQTATALVEAVAPQNTRAEIMAVYDGPGRSVYAFSAGLPGLGRRRR